MSDAAEIAGPGLERELIRDARVIAVVAHSAAPDRPWRGVARHLIDVGYTVYLVNPALDEALGRRCYDRLQELPEHIDIVDVFVVPERMPPIVEDAIEVSAGAIWMQLGIRHEAAARRASTSGLQVVMDRCTKIEQRRLPLAERPREHG